MGRMRPSLSHHFSQNGRIINYHAGTEQVSAVGLTFLDGLEEGGVQCLGQRFIPDILTGKMSENTGFDITPIINMKITAAAGDTTSYQRPITPEIGQQDGLGLPQGSDPFPSLHPLRGVGIRFISGFRPIGI